MQILITSITYITGSFQHNLEMFLNSSSVLTKTAVELADIKPPIPFYVEQEPIHYAAIIALVAALFLIADFMLYTYIRKIIEKQNNTDPTPLDMLWDLEKKHHLKSSQFYFRLSLILKYHIKDEFGYNCLADTTSEISQKLESITDNMQERDKLISLLKTLDNAKYQVGTPDEQKAANYLSTAKKILTKPVPIDESRH